MNYDYYCKFCGQGLSHPDAVHNCVMPVKYGPKPPTVKEMQDGISRTLEDTFGRKYKDRWHKLERMLQEKLDAEPAWKDKMGSKGMSEGRWFFFRGIATVQKWMEKLEEEE